MSEEKQLSTTEIPDFLAPVEGEKGMVGGQNLKDFVRPAFAKVVQGRTRPPITPPYKAGDLIILPDLIPITEDPEEKFHIVPIYNYIEFTHQNPWGHNDYIIEKTFDPESEIAKKAMSRKPEVREYPCPSMPGKKCSYCQHINFICVLLDHNEGLKLRPIVFTFFKGTWRYGSNFATLINGRSETVNHICGNRFEGHVGTYKSGPNEWPGVFFSNPSDGNKYVTDASQFELFKEMHQRFHDAYQSEDLDTDYEVEDSEESAANSKEF